MSSVPTGPSRSPAITLAEAIQSLKDSITICVKHGYTEAICCGPEGAAPFRHSGEMLIDDALEVIALLTPSETAKPDSLHTQTAVDEMAYVDRQIDSMWFALRQVDGKPADKAWAAEWAKHTRNAYLRMARRLDSALIAGGERGSEVK